MAYVLIAIRAFDRRKLFPATFDFLSLCSILPLGCQRVAPPAAQKPASGYGGSPL